MPWEVADVGIFCFSRWGGDLEDYNLIMRTLAEYETECVFHLGAQTIVGVGNRSPLTTFKANIEGTWSLLEAARVLNGYANDLKAVCVASSDKAYGSSKELPYQEEMPLHGEHPYDVSKSCTDLIAQCYGRTYGLPVSIARMGNIYGARGLKLQPDCPRMIRSVPLKPRRSGATERRFAIFLRRGCG